MADLIPEPPDAAALYWPPQDADELPIVAVRDDRAAELWGDPEQRWFTPNVGSAEPVTWEALGAEIAAGEYDFAEAVVLLPQAEVERLVNEAQREVQVVPLGEHLKEPGGWCRTHGVHHSEVEWSRIHDQLQAEADRG